MGIRISKTLHVKKHKRISACDVVIPCPGRKSQGRNRGYTTCFKKKFLGLGIKFLTAQTIREAAMNPKNAIKYQMFWSSSILAYNIGTMNDVLGDGG